MNFAKWISASVKCDGSALTFKKSFSADGAVSAVIKVSGLGTYCASINGKKVGRQVLTPGWTSYTYRVQYQTVDVTELLEKDNVIEIGVGPGWAVGTLGYHHEFGLYADRVCTVAEIELTYADGRVEYVYTDESWDIYSNEVTFSDIYNGETIDKTAGEKYYGKAIIASYQFNAVAQIGADITEQEIIKPAIVEAYEREILAFGPFAADGFFASGQFKNYDAILAMYHDQGLAPFKTLTPNGVNFTASLTEPPPLSR